MKGSPVRVRASASLICGDFWREGTAGIAASAPEGSTRGLREAAARPLRIAASLRLRRRHLVAGDGALDAKVLTRAAAVVDHVAPDEGVRLGRPEPLVGEDADEGGVLWVEAGA